MDRNQKASLGCGSLILIALIVLIFGNSGNARIKDKLQDLDSHVRALTVSIQAQNEELIRLRSAIEALKPQGEAGR